MPGTGQDPDRVQRGPGESDPAHDGEERDRARDPHDEADDHLDGELLGHDPERAVVAFRELDHPDHEGDADGVVDSGFALENRPRSASDLARAEDRERHRGIGRSNGRADQAREDPLEAEDVVRGDGDGARREERADDPECEDRGRGGAGISAGRCAARRRTGSARWRRLPDARRSGSRPRPAAWARPRRPEARRPGRAPRTGPRSDRRAACRGARRRRSPRQPAR